MVRALACGMEGPRIKITLDRLSGKLSLFTQQHMGTPLSSELGKATLYKAGEGLGGKGGGDGPHPLHTIPSDT